jgi:hypothetical protein
MLLSVATESGDVDSSAMTSFRSDFDQVPAADGGGEGHVPSGSTVCMCSNLSTLPQTGNRRPEGEIDMRGNDAGCISDSQSKNHLTR